MVESVIKMVISKLLAKCDFTFTSNIVLNVVKCYLNRKYVLKIKNFTLATYL